MRGEAAESALGGIRCRAFFVIDDARDGIDHGRDPDRRLHRRARADLVLAQDLLVRGDALAQPLTTTPRSEISSKSASAMPRIAGHR